MEEGALPKHDGGLLCKEECNSSSCPEHDYTSAFLLKLCFSMMSILDLGFYISTGLLCQPCNSHQIVVNRGGIRNGVL